MHVVQLTTISRFVIMTRLTHNYNYKVTINHVTLSSMSTIFDSLSENLTYNNFVMGFETPLIGSPHYQVYIGGTPYTQYEQLRLLISRTIQDLVIEGDTSCFKATVVAFPVEVDENNSEDHLLTYCKKDGTYIHRFLDGERYTVQCGANDLVGSWYHVDDFCANYHFKHFMENGKFMPSMLSHRKVFNFDSKK